MKIKLVPRNDIKITKKATTRFLPLIEALRQLQPGGQAIEVTYSNDKEFAAMRNVVYTFNRENGVKIRSNKDSVSGKVYYYINK